MPSTFTTFYLLPSAAYLLPSTLVRFAGSQSKSTKIAVRTSGKSVIAPRPLSSLVRLLHANESSAGYLKMSEPTPINCLKSVKMRSSFDDEVQRKFYAP
jgi:hypothetical protein